MKHHLTRVLVLAFGLSIVGNLLVHFFPLQLNLALLVYLPHLLPWLFFLGTVLFLYITLRLDQLKRADELKQQIHKELHEDALALLMFVYLGTSNVVNTLPFVSFACFAGAVVCLIDLTATVIVLYKYRNLWRQSNA